MCCAINRYALNLPLALVLTIVFLPRLRAQLNTGLLQATFYSPDGVRAGALPILITGAAGFRIVTQSTESGEVFAVLPYGRYRLSIPDQEGLFINVFVPPLQTLKIDLTLTVRGLSRMAASPESAGLWSDTTNGKVYPETYSLQGILLNREPSIIAQPLDFTGIANNRLAVMSERGFSWTGTQFKLHGIDATDSYQPGFPLIVTDMQSFRAVVVGTEAALFISEPSASWHGSFLIAGTGAPLSSTNLPAPSARGLVRQPDRFNWFTRDRIEIGGSLTRWADLYAATAGEWASQTEPLAAHGTDQRSHLGFATARTRMLAGAANFFDVLYTGSRIALSSGGMPAGMEALSGNRMMPSFVLPGGFLNEPETDDFQFLQAGWTHVFHQRSGFGALELRYGDSAAHLDTKMPPVSESLVELFGGAVIGAPPLANFAARRHREIDAVWQPAPLSATAGRHQFVAGGTWESGEPRNRFTTPSDRNLITADGAPAFVAEFNTPVDSRETVHSLSASFADRIMWTPALSLDLGASADWSRGSLPAQSSPAGTYTPRRSFDAHSDLIVWNSLSPHAGFAWQVPHLRGLVLRGSYSRLYVPLAARYIDFENANALGGNLYRWLASNTNAAVQPVEQGSLLMRFGGPYSSISPALHRPYSDEFSVAAEFPFTHRSIATIHVFRRDEKERIAAINTGVPAQVFTPVAIADAGPDGIPGTFDDQLLNAYAQSPATFGQDHYLLTNPSGLRMLNAGFVAEIGTEWLGVTLHASFVAEKSYGPTNPGNAFYENDPDVVGALFTDPNSTIHAAGRIFMDRAFVGKLQAAYRLPRAWGGIDLASTTVYTDGLVFARQLLVTGLPQGPIVIATTVRGSPEGGNRAQFAIDWNVRASREFRLPVGRLVMMADLMNVTNAGQKLQENDLSGPSFNLRLPVAIQPPRFVRLGLRYEF